jgi:tetratricopeptide (TPR) repeat protein
MPSTTDHIQPIDDAIHSKIVNFCKEGDNYLEQEDYARAIHKYCDAFDIIPDPYENYEASTWVLTSLGNAYFLMGDYENALCSLQDVMHCPKAIGNPYIHLKLGQVQFETGNFTRAQDELARAYMGGGKEVFTDENPKYYEYLKTFLTGVDL